MKKMRIAGMLFLLTVVAGAFNTSAAQNTDKEKAKTDAKEVSKFKAGKALDANDIGFLNAINANGSKSRGAESKTEVKVGDKTYKVGDKLTADDAKSLSEKISAFRTANKPEKVAGARGAGDCYYYCYYDYYGNYICYWYCE